ncbi:MAG TPA: CbiX/SirB N-terminal domain-containing protein [Nitrospiria bacterium]
MNSSPPATKKGVILVGHGGIPKDIPRENVTRFKALEGSRRKTGEAPSQEERELDQRIRRWPRTPENDPYKAGLESLAEKLRPLLGEARLVLAYNEFCAPTLEEAVEELVREETHEITVLTSMMTPGGIHSEVEIPETLETLQAAYPAVSFRYIWPYDMARVAQMLSEHIIK